MISWRLLDKCKNTKKFKTYNLNNVILDYGRSYFYQANNMSAMERGFRLQNLSYSKFLHAVRKNPAIHESYTIHKYDNVIYVPTHRNFYHMMIDCIPRVYSAVKDDRPVVLCKNYVDILPNVFNAVKKWIAKEYILLPIVPHTINGLKSHSYHQRLIGNNIGIFSNTASNSVIALENNKIFGVAFWQQWLVENFTAQRQSRKILIYRDPGEGSLRLSNQDEIWENLRNLDFEKINPNDYTLEEIAVIMNSASLVIGAHGAGLTNIVFCQPNTKFIQLANNSGSELFYSKIAKTLDLDYHVLYGYNEITKMPVYDNRNENYIVDIEAILSIISTNK